MQFYLFILFCVRGNVKRKKKQTHWHIALTKIRVQFFFKQIMTSSIWLRLEDIIKVPKIDLKKPSSKMIPYQICEVKAGEFDF